MKVSHTFCQRKSFAPVECFFFVFFLLHRLLSVLNTSKTHVISIISARSTFQSYFWLFAWLCRIQIYTYVSDSPIHVPFLAITLVYKFRPIFCFCICRNFRYFYSSWSFVYCTLHKYILCKRMFQMIWGWWWSIEKRERERKKIVILFPSRSKLFFVCHHYFCCSFFIRLHSYPHENQDLYLHCMLYNNNAKLHFKCGNCCTLQFHHVHTAQTQNTQTSALNALRTCLCFILYIYMNTLCVCKFPFALPADIIIIHVCLCFKSVKICSTFRQFFITYIVWNATARKMSRLR